MLTRVSYLHGQSQDEPGEVVSSVYSLILHCLLQITDSPRFLWRGVLLDVGRHYFGVEFIKKMLDVMALYKFNRFHWHLTEDQVCTPSTQYVQYFIRTMQDPPLSTTMTDDA